MSYQKKKIHKKYLNSRISHKNDCTECFYKKASATVNTENDYAKKTSTQKTMNAGT